MVNRIRKTDFVPVGNGHSVGFVVNSNEGIVADFGAGDRRYLNASPGVVLVTADTTLTPEQNGAVVGFDSAVARVVSLPAAADAPGCVFHFFWKTLATSGTGHSISPVAGDGVGGQGLTSVDGKDLLVVTASDTITDKVSIVSDGVADWHIFTFAGTFSKEA